MYLTFRLGFNIFLFLLLFSNILFAQALNFNRPDDKNNSSKALQQQIDSAEAGLELYYSTKHRYKEESRIKDNLKKSRGAKKKLQQDLGRTVIKLEKELKEAKEKLVTIQKELGKIGSTLIESDSALKSLQKGIGDSDKDYLVLKNGMEKEAQQLIGGYKIEYKGVYYNVFVVDLNSHQINLHLKFPDSTAEKNQNFSRLGTLKKFLEKNGSKVLMLTNGGMYTPSNESEGLLISNNKIIDPIDVGDAPKGTLLNFYLKPNGVFYIKNNKAYVAETKAYLKSQAQDTSLPRCATQSGPMLVVNGYHHPALNHNSKSKKLRSGVGIMDNGKIVFLISRTNSQPTNFHDFATIFKDIFGCENALFLDGAISKMYLPKIAKSDLGGSFGPIISVTVK